MTATTPSGHPVITAVLIELDSSEQFRFPGLWGSLYMTKIEQIPRNQDVENVLLPSKLANVSFAPGLSVVLFTSFLSKQIMGKENFESLSGDKILSLGCVEEDRNIC